jgi:hypothetical protein
MNAAHLRDMVVRPTLQHLGTWSLVDEQLVMGTAAHESDGFRYLKQAGGGPALGLWQMEPATYDDLHANYLAYKRDRAVKLQGLVADWPVGAAALPTNLAYGAALCHLQYLRYRKGYVLPMPGDVQAIAAVWKQVWNTHRGKGTVGKFVDDWRLWIGDLY